jgi:hypothetical protein
LHLRPLVAAQAVSESWRRLPLRPMIPVISDGSK